jgi:hypothetical protein
MFTVCKYNVVYVSIKYITLHIKTSASVQCDVCILVNIYKLWLLLQSHVKSYVGYVFEMSRISQ